MPHRSDDIGPRRQQRVGRRDRRRALRLGTAGRCVAAAVDAGRLAIERRGDVVRAPRRVARGVDRRVGHPVAQRAAGRGVGRAVRRRRERGRRTVAEREPKVAVAKSADANRLAGPARASPAPTVIANSPPCRASPLKRNVTAPSGLRQLPFSAAGATDSTRSSTTMPPRPSASTMVSMPSPLSNR